MAKFVQFGNGAVLDAEDILVVVRKDINQYGVVLKTCPQVTINADGSDVDALKTLLDVTVFETPKTIIKQGLVDPV